MNLEENKENLQKMYVAIKTVDNLIYPVEWEWARQSMTNAISGWNATLHSRIGMLNSWTTFLLYYVVSR